MKLPGLEIGADVDRLPWRQTRVPGVAWLPLAAFPGGEPEGPERGEALQGAPRGSAPGVGGAYRGGGAVLVRMEPGAGYTPHRHVGPEVVLVLRGGYRDDRGEHRSGDVVDYPAGSVHAPVALGDPARPIDASNPACVLFSVVPAGIELLDRPPA